MFMKYVSLLETPSEKFIELEVRKMGLDPEKFRNTAHPQEDFLCVSGKYPIFIVADGVALIQFLIEKKEYPNPSPAGDVARIFCEEALKAAEARYESFGESDIKEVFRVGNNAVGEYNRRHGRTKDTVDYWHTDFYAATAALVVMKENQVYWGSICDSYVMHFDAKGTLGFRSPDCNTMVQAEAPKFAGDSSDEKARAQYAWRVKRNGVNEKGERVGYGVVTGEPEALLYLASGSFSVQEGDLISVLTDGFEEYMKLPEFVSLFTKWTDDLEFQVKKFTTTKIDEDPEKFGHERTLVAVSV